MKKSVLVAFCFFLFALPSIYTQVEVGIDDKIEGIVAWNHSNKKVFNYFTRSSGGVGFIGIFEGTINGKSIEYKPEYKNLNNGTLSDKELQMIEAGIDVIKSVVNRSNFEVPDVSFTVKANGKILLVSGKSRTENENVFEGKYEGRFFMINNNEINEHLDFKQIGNDIIVNNGALSKNKIQMIELGLASIGFKRFLQARESE